MRDLLEGITASGHIRTGARRERISGAFDSLLAACVADITGAAPDASVYVYGSVANGAAISPSSDVDLLTVGLPADRAVALGLELSARSIDLCRGVEIGAAMSDGLEGEGDEAYGMRVFVHHYCVLLAGPDVDRASAPFRADRRAARGFNGDIGRCANRWRADLPVVDPAELGRRAARKTLLAVAGLVSIDDAIWTTDRELGARRWAELRPELADGLGQLLDWSAGGALADRVLLTARLDDTVAPIVRDFDERIGLWPN